MRYGRFSLYLTSLLTAFALLTTPSHAETKKSGRWYLSPSLELTFPKYPDEVQDFFEESFSFSCSFGRVSSGNFGIRFPVSRSKFHAIDNIPAELTITSAGVELLAYLFPNSRIIPYTVSGATYSRVRTKTKSPSEEESEKGLSLSMGAGILIPLGKRFFVNAEGLTSKTYISPKSFDASRLEIGLGIFLGEK